MSTVLITGGSGLIGTALTKALLSSGWSVHHLGRTQRDDGPVRSFVWDLRKGTIDRAALKGVEHIVHLAGAGIADERWTEERIVELIDSRVGTSRLLMKAVLEEHTSIRTMVSAAGINYYGAQTSSHVFTEDDPPGGDTIARISKDWEDAVDEWTPYARVVKLRTPIVLAREGGALKKLAAPVKWGLGAALGTGEQWMPWVHIDDLVRIYMQALSDDRMRGAYNVNTGNDVTNSEFMRTLARVLRRPYFLPNIPGWILKIALGELAIILLEGSRASNSKLLATGSEFRSATLLPALEDLER